MSPGRILVCESARKMTSSFENQYCAAKVSYVTIDSFIPWIAVMASARPRRTAAAIALNAMLENEESDEEIDRQISDGSDDQVEDIDIIHSQQQSDVGDDEESDEGVATLPSSSSNELLHDKTGHAWTQQAPIQRRRDAANIYNQRPGPTAAAVRNTPKETLELFFNDEILNKILHYSRAKASSLGIDVVLDVNQLKAYMAILYYRGLNHDQKVPISELWSEEYSSFYRATMSRTLFKIWSRILRFDDIETREERKEIDNFAAIREIWSMWNERLRMFWNASSCITVDEQLVASRCRSPNRVYNPSKPGKYGELIRWCADADYRYFLNGLPVTKRPNDADAAHEHKIENQAKNIVMTLTNPFLDEGRNVTADRFFSSVPLAEALLQRKTTLVGTMMKNKREIPPILHEKMEKYESAFVFGGHGKKVTLQSQQIKPNRKCYLISSMHHSATTDDTEKRKSDIQLFYNMTKPGVDVVDEMCKMYTTRCKVYRWPLVHFQNMMDISAINAYAIFTSSHDEWSSIPLQKRRRQFLRQLAMELAQDNMEKRLRDPIGLSTAAVDSLARLTGKPNPRKPNSLETNQHHEVNRMRRCMRCRDAGKPTRNCTPTSNCCVQCNEPVCGKHGKSMNFVCCKCQSE